MNVSPCGCPKTLIGCKHLWRCLISGRSSDLDLRESRRPLAKGVPCPPPPKKIRTPVFPQFGACPDFCRDTLRNRSGSVSRKFWVALSNVSRFFSGHPLKSCVHEGVAFSGAYLVACMFHFPMLRQERTCTQCPQINCDVATSDKIGWPLFRIIVATGLDFQNGKEQF